MTTKKPLIRQFLFSAKRTIVLTYQTISLFNWYLRPKISLLVRKTFGTGEYTNFTYDLTEKNLRYLAYTISQVTNRPVDEVTKFISEGRDDEKLKAHLNRSLLDHNLSAREDVKSAFGRRLGWYALVRILRPKVIVETGVDKGHGSILLSAALLRNSSEGYPGRYFGLDIAPTAGWLLAGEYARVGEIIYGDSLQSLKNLNCEIDMFINDSDHSADYEFREYHTVLPKLSARAIIVGDNAHATDRLCKFSEETGRQFLFFREEPADHWYFGAGIGMSFNRPV